MRSSLFLVFYFPTNMSNYGNVIPINASKGPAFAILQRSDLCFFYDRILLFV